MLKAEVTPARLIRPLVSCPHGDKCHRLRRRSRGHAVPGLRGSGRRPHERATHRWLRWTRERRLRRHHRRRTHYRCWSDGAGQSPSGGASAGPDRTHGASRARGHARPLVLPDGLEGGRPGCGQLCDALPGERRDDHPHRRRARPRRRSPHQAPHRCRPPAGTHNPRVVALSLRDCERHPTRNDPPGKSLDGPTRERPRSRLTSPCAARNSSAAIRAAHERGLKVTGHLCAVGFQEAIGLGIDNLEHGLLVDTEFFSGKQPNQCPGQSETLGELQSIRYLGPSRPAAHLGARETRSGHYVHTGDLRDLHRPRAARSPHARRPRAQPAEQLSRRAGKARRSQCARHGRVEPAIDFAATSSRRQSGRRTSAASR